MLTFYEISATDNPIRLHTLKGLYRRTSIRWRGRLAESSCGYGTMSVIWRRGWKSDVLVPTIFEVLTIMLSSAAAAVDVMLSRSWNRLSTHKNDRRLMQPRVVLRTNKQIRKPSCR